MLILQHQILVFCFFSFFCTLRATETPLDHLRRALSKRNAVTSCLTADFEAQCSTSPNDCVTAMCDACQGVPIIAECCSLASLTAKFACFQDVRNNPSELTMTTSISTNATATTTNLISVAPLAGLEACAEVYTIRQSCQNQSLGFATASFSDQASCLCYQAGTFNATIYDGAWATCLAYASPTSPALYTSLTSLWGSDKSPCSLVGPGNNLSTTSSRSIWYIGYTTGLSAEPSFVPTGQPSMIATAANASATNGCNKSSFVSFRQATRKHLS